MRFRHGYVLIVADADINKVSFYLNRENRDLIAVTIETFAIAKGVRPFVKRAGNFWFITSGTDHPARKDHLPFVRAKVLTGVPFVPSCEIEHGYLHAVIAHTYAGVLWEIGYFGGSEPYRDFFAGFIGFFYVHRSNVSGRINYFLFQSGGHF